VEDDPDVTAIAELALADLGGLDVVTCANAAEAMVRVEMVEPDLVVMDLTLPDADGVVLAGRMRDALGSATPPVVFLTARPDRAEALAAASPGILGVLSKPFDPLSLAASLRALWANWNRTDGGAVGS